MFLLAWKLYSEFAWVTFRQVEADLAMRRRLLYFQVTDLFAKTRSDDVLI
jgi:hypothetical protein